MSEEYTRIKVSVIRTLTPIPYHSVKIGLELEGQVNVSLDKFTPEALEQSYAARYNNLKKILNEMEIYETNRLKGK